METPARHYRVLPMDDENNVLNTHKFIVYTFASPQKTLRAAQEIPYHCAISDYRMPSMDGVELKSSIVQAIAQRNLPIEKRLLANTLKKHPSIN